MKLQNNHLTLINVSRQTSGVLTRARLHPDVGSRKPIDKIVEEYALHHNVFIDRHEVRSRGSLHDTLYTTLYTA